MSLTGGTMPYHVAMWCNTRIGQKVDPNKSGGNQCTEMCDGALRANGYRGIQSYNKPLKSDGDYVWGKRVNNLKGEMGFILQFKGVKWTVPGSTAKPSRSHHSAVIWSRENGFFWILEQNIPANEPIRKNKFYYSRITQGQFWCYEPQFA